MGGAFRAGILMHRVAIEAPVGGKNVDGSPAGGFSPVATGVPANVVEGPVRDVVKARKVDARVSSIVRLRYFPALTGRHRFVYGTRTLNIVGEPTNPDGRRIEHLCYCSEGPAGG